MIRLSLIGVNAKLQPYPLSIDDIAALPVARPPSTFVTFAVELARNLPPLDLLGVSTYAGTCKRANR